jgi:hypothetical protein
MAPDSFVCLAYRELTSTRAQVRVKAFGDASIVVEETTDDCNERALRSGRVRRIRRQLRMAWQGKLSSNHRERARFVSPCRQRQMRRPARRALVPLAKLFAVTFFSDCFPMVFCIV